jgi:hypothetical protein
MGFSQYQLDGQYNYDVWKPYTEEAQEYIKINNKVESQTWHVRALYELKEFGSNKFAVGLSYKNTHHLVKDKILYYTQPHISMGQILYWWTVYKPTDLVTTSHSIGLVLDYSRRVFQLKKQEGFVGVYFENYFLEFFKSEYVIKFDQGDDFILQSDAEPELFYLYGNYLFPSSNVNLYYNHRFLIGKKFNAGLKISSGINLFNKYDQFRKYFWLGAGLQIGLVRSNKQK